MREGHHRGMRAKVRPDRGRPAHLASGSACDRAHSGLSQTGKIERKAGAPRCPILNHNCSHVCIGNAPHY